MCNAYNHPPGCTCGWGGDGHAGTSWGGWGEAYTFTVNTTEWKERDAAWHTHCPECHLPVFFIRHNGGSVWVDPPPGYPWPKHACFDKPSEKTPTFDLLKSKMPQMANSKVGVITQMIRRGDYHDPQVEITECGGERFLATLRWVPPADDMLGDMILYSIEEGYLFHLRHAEIPIQSVSKKSGPTDEWYKCTRCGAKVKEGAGHEEYCRKHFEKPPNRFYAEGSLKSRRLKYTPKHSWSPPLVSPTDWKPKKSIELRVERAVVIVADTAWQAVRQIREAERLGRAKNKVMQLCRVLNPDIRERVKKAFTSNGWRPLIERRPSDR